jgi:hypothetical protein
LPVLGRVPIRHDELHHIDNVLVVLIHGGLPY